MPRMIVRLLLLTGYLSLCWAAPAQQMRDKPVYEIFAISYGIIPDFPVSGLVAGAERSRKMDIQMMVWLLKGLRAEIFLWTRASSGQVPSIIQGEGFHQAVRGSRRGDHGGSGNGSSLIYLGPRGGITLFLPGSGFRRTNTTTTRVRRGSLRLLTAGSTPKT
jgi:hypothetical protein